MASVERLFSRAYGENVEHLLVYRLRNLLVHYSMDCVRLELASPDDVVASRPHRMVLDREVVLKAPKAVNGAIRNYLESLPEDPDVEELFKSAMKSLRAVFRQTRPFTYPEGHQDMQTIRELDRLFGNATGTRAVAQLPGDYNVNRIETRLNIILDEIFQFSLSDGTAEPRSTPPSATPSINLGITPVEHR
jgi:hypothetical protein